MRQSPVRLYSFGGAVLAALISLLSQLIGAAAPQPRADAVCLAAPPFQVSLPQQIMFTPASTPAAVATRTPTAGAARPASTGAPGAADIRQTPVATPSSDLLSAASLRRLLRNDDPPEGHDLALLSGSAMPYVIPATCQLPAGLRRRDPCVKLQAPLASLCVSGAVGGGRIDAVALPAFAFQAGRAVIRDAQGSAVYDQLQGYFRMDEPSHGLVLVCPGLQTLQNVGFDARRFTATCTNRGEDGWSVAAQVNDGANAAPDSISVEVQGPGLTHLSLAGSLVRGAIVVRDVAGLPAG